MKKILIFAVVLLIVSAYVFGGGQREPFEYKYSVEDFQGTWQQVNGSTIITIKGNDFEMLNMEIGYAGYGIVSMGTWYKDKVNTEAIRFDFHNDGEGRSTKGNILFLNSTKELMNENKKERNFVINDFQMRYWEEFSPISEKNNRYSNDVIKKYFTEYLLYNKRAAPPTFFGGGGNPYFFELNGDNLKLIDVHDEITINSSIGWYLRHLFFTGEFIKVK